LILERLYRQVLCALALIALASSAGAQGAAGGPAPLEVSGAANITNKGISLIPALTLGRPAAIVDLAVRKRNVGFEPQFRFGLDGKPWSFLFWARYRVATDGKFRLTLGGHPALSFRTTAVPSGETSRDLIEVRRYLGGEVVPSYVLTPSVAVGAYYLYAHGFDGATRHTHFVAARMTASNVEVFRGYVLQFVPQIYYLSTNGQRGSYVGASASVARQGSPISIGTIVNQPLHSAVIGGQVFLWNVSVTYAFR